MNGRSNTRCGTGRRDQVMADWKTGLVKLTEYYHWDAVLVHNVIGHGTPVEKPAPLDENRWRLDNGNILQYSPETDAFMIVEKPAAPPPPAVPAAPVSPEPTASELEVVRHVVRELGRTHFIFSAPLTGHPQLRYPDATRSEVENWVAVFEDPEAAGERRLQAMTSPNLRLGIEIARREGLDGVATGCDYGYNAGPFIPPEMFRIAVFPALKAFCDLAHAQGLTVLHHSCGKNVALLDQLVEAGVDIWQSIQPENDIAAVKKRYGKNLTLWGGMPADLLVTGNPGQVRAAGRQALRDCAPGGGFIYGTSHSVMPGAKLENYQAMLDVLRGGNPAEPAKAAMPKRKCWISAAENYCRNPPFKTPHEFLLLHFHGCLADGHARAMPDGGRAGNRRRGL